MLWGLNRAERLPCYFSPKKSQDFTQDKAFLILGLQFKHAMLNLHPSAQQGRPHSQFGLAVVSIKVVMSQHWFLSTLIVQALHLGLLRHRFLQSSQPSDFSASTSVNWRPRPPSMKAPSTTAQQLMAGGCTS